MEKILGSDGSKCARNRWHYFGLFFSIPFLLWSFLACLYFPLYPQFVGGLLGITYLVFLWFQWRKSSRRMFIFLVSGLVLLNLLLLVPRARDDRPWASDQIRCIQVNKQGSLLGIENVRNFTYRTETDFDPLWQTRHYDLETLQSADFVIENFSDHKAMAHVFISFAFADGRHLAISVEIRREQGESFNPLRGLFRAYELYYAVGDERDIIGLRHIHRRSKLRLYRVKADKTGLQSLLMAMLERAEKLQREPEFYHSVRSNCMLNLLQHVEALLDEDYGFDLRILFPGYAAEFAHDHDLIDLQEKNLEGAEARALILIPGEVLQGMNEIEFSRAIRLKP